MQKIPVTLDGKRGSEVVIIDSDQVVRIDKIKEREYVVHTREHQYYLDITFDSIEEWLFEDGFRLLDSTNIVNMNHVSYYDSNRGLVYLGDPRNKKTKTASAARIHKDHIVNVMEMLEATDNEKKGGHDDSDRTDELLKTILSQESDERFLRSYATIRAVTERKRAEEKIHHMAFHDALTDLPNRRLFHERLKELFEDARHQDRMAAVLFIDVDRLKNINDTLGHHVGDEVLKQLARRIQAYVKENDTAARFSGDEFIILMSNVSHVDEVSNFAKGMSPLLKGPYYYGHQELYITASIGISLFPANGRDTDTLIKNADSAMYRAKEKGGNTFQFYNDEMNKRSMEKLSLEVSLYKALERNEISVYYQPLLDLQTGQIFGMESLVRWNHPELGMISPATFIPLAEETGLIVPIGNWVLREACAQTRTWQNKGYDSLSVSVNISVNQFQQPGFVQYIAHTLDETDLHPNKLCLEITESVAMKNVSYVADTIARLRQLGVQISIDDFGTGYSSLSYLKRFRVHTLKIDQSFIRDVTTDEDNAAIVTALIAMSQQLKIKSLAEGVETKDQLEFLRVQGCNEIQGYVFSKPLSSNDFEYMLRENKNLYDYVQ
jgi:diguanylate cyclase (GGDEF)-like protein